VPRTDRGRSGRRADAQGDTNAPRRNEDREAEIKLFFQFFTDGQEEVDRLTVPFEPSVDPIVFKKRAGAADRCDAPAAARRRLRHGGQSGVQDGGHVERVDAQPDD
jgi:hypothetical protein